MLILIIVIIALSVYSCKQRNIGFNNNIGGGGNWADKPPQWVGGAPQQLGRAWNESASHAMDEGGY